MVRWENYEEYMMMHADGELNPTEESALLAFVAAHGLEKELAAYGMLKMAPDTRIVYTGKDKLLKEEKKATAMPVWQRYTIAAGVAAIIFISLFKYSVTDKNSIAVAKVDDTKQEQGAPATNSNISVQQGASVRLSDSLATKAIVSTAAASGDNAPVATKVSTAVHNKANSALMHKEQTIQMPVAANMTINELRPAGIKQIGSTPAAGTEVAIIAVPALPDAIAADEQPQTRTLSITLPIEDLKKQGIANVNALLATGADKLHALKQEISEARLTIKVERRKLILSF